MALNVGLEVSFSDTQDHKGMREKAGKVTVSKFIKQMKILLLEFSADVIVCSLITVSTPVSDYF
jgi:hypothetical protein